MNKLFIGSIVMVMLAACGGGGSSSTSGPAPVSSVSPPSSSVTPPAANATTPAPSQQVVPAPVAPASAMQLTTRAFNQGSNSQDSVVKFSGAADLTVSGQLNRIWVSAAQPGGTLKVGGGQNTIVVAPGVDATISVTGAANTFYLPAGSTVKPEGTGAASSTILYYKA